MTPDLQFIINCCKVKPTKDDIEAICTHITEINQQQLIDIIALAHKHGIFSLLYLAIKTHASERLSKNSLNRLKDYNLAIVMQNMQMVAELIRINKLLQENGIMTLAFKGPALAQLAYGNIALRQFGDLDILIKKQDISKAIALLKDDQFIPEIDLSKNMQETFFACTNVIGLQKTCLIEIHWELLAKNYAIDWQQAELWKTIDITRICDTNIPVLAYNTHLLYLCAHGSKHLFERLEWVSDIDRFIRINPEIKWQTLMCNAQEKGIERMCLLGLYLCQTLLDLKLPANISQQITCDSAVIKLGNKIIYRHLSSSVTKEKSYAVFWLLWCMREKLTDRIKFTFKGMLSPKTDDFKNLALPKQLVFLYPIIRPIRLLIKYL